MMLWNSAVNDEGGNLRWSFMKLGWSVARFVCRSLTLFVDCSKIQCQHWVIIKGFSLEVVLRAFRRNQSPLWEGLLSVRLLFRAVLTIKNYVFNRLQGKTFKMVLSFSQKMITQSIVKYQWSRCFVLHKMHCKEKPDHLDPQNWKTFSVMNNISQQGRIHGIRCVPARTASNFGRKRHFWRISIRVWPTDRRTNLWTDGRTDTPFYRDPRTHLKTWGNRRGTGYKDLWGNQLRYNIEIGNQ